MSNEIRYQHSKKKEVVPIYNGAPNLVSEKLRLHKSIPMRELWPGDGANPDDYGIIDNDHVQSYVAALPNDRPYEFDLEGNSDRPDLNLHLWDYLSNPIDAVRLREEMSQQIWLGQPELDRGFWSIPSGEWLRLSAKDPADQNKAYQTMQTQLDYQQLSSWQSTLYQSAYWRYERDAVDMIPEWKTEVRAKIGLTEMYQGKTPRIYIWHRGYALTDDEFIDSDIFDQMVEFIANQPAEIVFWSKQSDTDFPPWVLDTLEKYSS